MASKPAIGFIGVGFMGHGMAANILKGGYPLQVMGRRNRVPVEDLLSKGATEAATPREMAASCDIIHLCLSNSDQVEGVIRGPDGILASGKTGLIVIDTTTADPTSTVSLAEELAAAGMTLVDAPLGRTPKEAEAGTLDTMVGAEAEVLERVRPVIECWAGTITHTGGTGTGHKMKLIMNFISMGYAAMFSEAVVVAAKAGLSPQIVRQVIGGSRMNNPFFETFMRYVVDRDGEAHKFTIANGSKDVRYLASMAAGAGVANLIGASVKDYFTMAEGMGKGQDFVPTLSDFVATLNGLDLAAAVEDGKA